MPTDTLDSTFAVLADPTRRDPGAPRFEGRGVRQSPNTKPPEQKIVIIKRVIDAPRELVFEAWTEPEHFVRWWGPK